MTDHSGMNTSNTSRLHHGQNCINYVQSRSLKQVGNCKCWQNPGS